MDWEYKITKCNLWYNVFREKEEEWIVKLERLQRDTYTLNREFAKVFYHLQDAESALTIAKFRWRKETSERKPEFTPPRVIEKRSWSEFW